MTHRYTKILILAVGLALGLGAITTEAEASRFSEWFFGPSAAQTTAYTPWTTAYPPAAPAAASHMNYVAPSATYVAPSVPWYERLRLPWLTHTANYPGSCAPTATRPMVVRYIPRTCYRTVWVSVPVTTYRPVNTCDPVTGCQVTCMRPCTSMTWQARRVPYTTFRAVYRPAWLPALFAAPACGPAGCPTGVTCGPGGCPTGAGCGVRTFGAAFGACNGAGCRSCAPVSPATPPAGPSGLSPVPADRPPSLKSRPSTGVGPGPQDLQKPVTPPEEKKTEIPDLTPIPDPEAEGARLKSGDIPKLLDPRDKTAEQPREQRWAVNPIVWPDKPARPVKQATAEKPVEKRWDDSGWEPAPY